MATRKTQKSTTQHKIEGELRASDLYELIDRPAPNGPVNATVRLYFEVPGGGDWSNTDIDIDDNPHTVKYEVIWTTTEEK